MFDMDRSLPLNIITASLPAIVNIRPVEIDDVDAIMQMHQRLSSITIYKRYHSPRLPSRNEIRQICELNGVQGVALVATIPGNKMEIVGLAYFIVTGRDEAETAILVEDRFQGQGIGNRLLKQMKWRAVKQGICFFDALILPSNRVMMRLMHKIGPLVRNSLELGTREVRVALCP